jgi:hypothetical protein
MIITLEMLRQKHACRDQVARFKELFGDAVEVTVELAVKHAQDFAWDWAARSLLSAAGYSAYIAARAKARRAYPAARAKSRRAYAAALAAAEVAYAAATDEARLAYAAATDEARLAYAAALAESPRAYNAACARAFAEAAIGEDTLQASQ